MANDWGITQPADIDSRVWSSAEAFANSVQSDVGGDWIIPLENSGPGTRAIAQLLRGRWAALPDDAARWAFALAVRIEQIENQLNEDPTFLDKVVDFAIPIVTGLLFGIPIGGGSGGGLGDILSGGDDGASDLRYATNAALNSLVDTGRRSTEILTTLSSLILGNLDQRNRESTDSVLGLVDTSTRGIDILLRSGKELLEAITGKSIGGIEAVLEDTFGKTGEILGRIFGVIDGALDSSTENNSQVAAAVIRGIDSEVEQARRNSDAIDRNLTTAIGRITDTSDSVLGGILQALTSEGSAQATATKEGAQALGEILNQNLGKLGGTLARLTGEGDGNSPEAVKGRINKAFDNVMGGGSCPTDFVEFIHDFVDKLTADWDPSTPIMHILAEVQYMQGIFAPALAVLGNCVAQMAARAAPTALATSAELQEQMKQGLIDKPEAMQDLLSQGYTPERADRLLALRRRLPEVGFVQTWFLRGMITADQAFDYLQKLGFELDDAQAILEMAYTIPPPQDLITMAVREVFSPQVAQRFGQYEDFPKAFADYALQQGISEEWARRYWAAHWGLPSPQQGFEMYQRDVISREDLELLLKSLDIMPFWRDRLTQIAFRPVTRVDIRRMHQLKLIDHAETVKRYRHMGYSPDDAEFMTRFTERLNAPKGEQDVEELEGATKANIVALYKRGVIGEDDARELLSEMGAGDRAINVLLTNARTQLELEHRDDETAVILEEASAGVISVDAAGDRLGALGLTALEQQKARAKLRKIGARQTKLPTRAEGEKMFRADALSEVEYGLLLKQLGYSIYWVDRFLQLAKSEED